MLLNLENEPRTNRFSGATVHGTVIHTGFEELVVVNISCPLISRAAEIAMLVGGLCG